MKHNIKEYRINVEDSGRITLKLEIELQKLGEERTAFTTRDALQLLVDEGYCKNTNEIRIIKGGIAWNWGGSPNKDDWTFKYREEKAPVIKKEPVKAKPADKPIDKPVVKAAVKEPTKKSKTTTKKATNKKTTQEVLAGLKTKGN